MRDAIVVETLGKRYFRRNPNRPRTIHEALIRGARGMGPTEGFWALKNITFRVSRGSMLGVIGRNSAGKSTLLRLLGAIDIPTEGTVATVGHVGALLTLGVGFHPDLTGRENVFISGVVSGLTRAEVRRRFDSIVEFAELRDFIDSPLRIYSSGMAMRLRFAVAIHTEPDILLIDEVLSVGDAAFQEKCLQQIRRFKRNGCTIVLISHGLDLVLDMCDSALWLDCGRLLAKGRPGDVVDQYVTQSHAQAPAGRKEVAADVVEVR